MYVSLLGWKMLIKVLYRVSASVSGCRSAGMGISGKRSGAASTVAAEGGEAEAAQEWRKGIRGGD